MDRSCKLSHLPGFGCNRLAGQGITEAIASFCSGLSLGMLITAVLYTSNSIYKIKAFKKSPFGEKIKLLSQQISGSGYLLTIRYGPEKTFMFSGPYLFRLSDFKRFPI